MLERSIQHRGATMRRTLELAGIGILAILWWITWGAVNGAQKLQDHVPTHFDISGNANAWGPTNTLFLLPIIGTAVYLLITGLASLPITRVNLPVRVTPVNLPFIQQRTREMISWIKVEMSLLFVYVQWTIMEAARKGEFRMSPVMVPVFVICVLGTVAVYLFIIVNGAKERKQSLPSR
jgi:uncharacterized membrane protein